LATNFQPKDISAPRSAKFCETARQPMHVLFPKQQISASHQPSPAPAMVSLVSEDEGLREEILISVFLEDPKYALTRTTLLMLPSAKISDVLHAVARKLQISVEQLMLEFSAQDISGHLLESDAKVSSSHGGVILKPRQI
jgi:hypothetical protein